MASQAPYSTVRGHVLGGRYGFPFSLLLSLCCITVSSEGDSKDKGWKRKRKESRKRSGTGGVRAGVIPGSTASNVRKQSPDRPGEATQSQHLCPLGGTLAEHKHRKFR